MNELWQEFRHAIRAVLRARGLTAATVMLLGVGVGASTTIFSAINNVVRRPLPYLDPDRLVTLRESNPRQNSPRAGVSAANFVDWRTLDRSFEGLAAYRPWGYVSPARGRPSGSPEPACPRTCSRSSASARCRAAPSCRMKTRPDATTACCSARNSGAAGSARHWSRRYPMRLDGKTYAVIGVVPSGFQLPAADVWVPLVFEPFAMAQRGNRAHSVIARLKPGVQLETARGDIGSGARTRADPSRLEIGAWDPVAFMGSALLLAGTGLLASYLPARRAARVDPIRALRGD